MHQISRKQLFIAAGFVVSFVLVALMWVRMDWAVFIATLRQIRVGWVLVTAFLIALGMMMRALRWNLIAGVSLALYDGFWRATSLGYLGNYIYPARAGEALRMVAVNRFTGLPMAQSISSAVADRINDGLTLGLFALIVIGVHGEAILQRQTVVVVSCVFAAGLIFLWAFATWGVHWQKPMERYAVLLPDWLASRVSRWYSHALAGIATFRDPKTLFIVLGLNCLVFLVDYCAMWALMSAFAWNLPFEAAMTVGVFLAAGTALPSAPGYIGVYQIACVVALRPYGVDESSAVAYSLVLQVVTLLVISVQGAIATVGFGFNEVSGSSAETQNQRLEGS